MGSWQSEEIKKGERPSDPVELIIRRVVRNGEFQEEKILRFGSTDSVTPEAIEALLSKAAKKLADSEGS